QDARLVGERYAGVDVEHMRAGFDLGDGVGADAAVVAGRHLGREQLAPGRVDALADEDERPLEADDGLLGRGADDGIGHGAVLSLAGRRGCRFCMMPDSVMISDTYSSWR